MADQIVSKETIKDRLKAVKKSAYKTSFKQLKINQL